MSHCSWERIREPAAAEAACASSPTRLVRAASRSSRTSSVVGDTSCKAASSSLCEALDAAWMTGKSSSATSCTDDCKRGIRGRLATVECLTARNALAAGRYGSVRRNTAEDAVASTDRVAWATVTPAWTTRIALVPSGDRSAATLGLGSPAAAFG